MGEFFSNSVLKMALVLIILLLFYLVASAFLKRALVKYVKTKKARHNITVSINLITYLFIFLSIIIIFVTYAGGLTGIGITAGLLTAALGWALQRPITGIAAWLMVIITKPFRIGDRVIIGSVKGDVVNLTITHIYLEEFGGTTAGEETSGRIIIIPNAFLFEQNVINYTAQNEYILDEVGFTITYSSDIEIAKQIALKAAEKGTKNFIEHVPMKPFVRSNFQASGVDIKVRYYTIAGIRQEINSDITEEIFKQVIKEKSVEFAYSHMEVYLNKKK